MRCANCGYIFFHNSAAAVAAIIEMPGGVVLVRRASAPKRGYCDLPGGFVDYGESLEAALQREIREELDTEITALRYFASFPNTYRYHNVTYFTTDAFFICRLAKSRSPRAQREISEFTVVPPQRIVLKEIAFPSTRQALAKYIEVNRSRRI